MDRIGVKETVYKLSFIGLLEVPEEHVVGRFDSLRNAVKAYDLVKGNLRFKHHDLRTVSPLVKPWQKHKYVEEYFSIEEEKIEVLNYVACKIEYNYPFLEMEVITGPVNESIFCNMYENNKGVAVGSFTIMTNKAIDGKLFTENFNILDTSGLNVYNLEDQLQKLLDISIAKV